MRSEQIAAWLFVIYLFVCVIAPILKLVGLLSISWGLLSTLYVPVVLLLITLGAMIFYVFNTTPENR